MQPAIAKAWDATDENDTDRQRRRLKDHSGFGGAWILRNGKWGAKDRKSGAFGKLVKQERENGSKNFSEKSVRVDLTTAAEAEADEKRAAIWVSAGA